MEERKLKEVEYYDNEAKTTLCSKKEAGSLKDFDPFFLESYHFLKDFFKTGYQDKAVLDYGCGMGVHLPWLVKSFQKVTGIDLSQSSLAKAQELGSGAVLVLGDCEKMPFSGESFDVVFDGGTFSSLDLEKALQEIHRVLKPGGLLAGIETFGHNPLTNLKRKLNIILEKRTAWAGDHILKMQDLDMVKKYFDILQLKFFHPISWVAFPFLNLPGGKWLLKILETIDHILLNIFL